MYGILPETVTTTADNTYEESPKLYQLLNLQSILIIQSCFSSLLVEGLMGAITVKRVLQKILIASVVEHS